MTFESTVSEVAESLSPASFSINNSLIDVFGLTQQCHSPPCSSSVKYRNSLTERERDMKFEEKWVTQKHVHEHHKIMVCNGARTDCNRLFLCACCEQVSDHGVLVMELGSGLSFPATEYLSRIIHTQALQGKDLSLFKGHLHETVMCGDLCLFQPPSPFHLLPLNVSPPASPPRSVVLDCCHVSIIDYSVISELRDLLRQFKLREVRLVFSSLQVRPSALAALQTFTEY